MIALEVLRFYATIKGGVLGSKVLRLSASISTIRLAPNDPTHVIQITRDRKQLEERLKDTLSALQEEENKGKTLTKQKVKLETAVNELEEKLNKEEKVRFINVFTDIICYKVVIYM